MSYSTSSPPVEVAILGAGVIGLSLALELHRRGAEVAVYEPRIAAAQASWAAAGMLAAQDPCNPPALGPLARMSTRIYPTFLAQIQQLSGVEVPFQTSVAHQRSASGATQTLQEHSLDPRQLAVGLLLAVQRAGIPLHQHHAPEATLEGAHIGSILVHAMGAWSETPHISPRKGQMLRVRLPPDNLLTEVYRSEPVYVVPRTKGPQAGTALIGATVEEAGFDTDVHLHDLQTLRRLGAELVPNVPELMDSRQTPVVEAWAGLRPATPDDLPLLGDLPTEQGRPRHVIAAGHYRNGILLAPATAVAIADLIENRPAKVDLSAFSPARFAYERSLSL